MARTPTATALAAEIAVTAESARAHFRHGAACDTEHRPPVGDRAGDGEARLRVLPRGTPAHRPAARPLRGGAPRCDDERPRLDAGAASARAARRAGPDVRE